MEYPIAFYKLLTSAFAIHALSSIGEASMPLPHKGAWEIQPTISIDPKMKPTKKRLRSHWGHHRQSKKHFRLHTYHIHIFTQPSMQIKPSVLYLKLTM